MPMNENNSNFTQTIFVRKHSQVPKENVRISNTKEGEAKGDKHIVRDLGRGGSQEKVRGSQANVRISNTKEDKAKGPKSQRKMSGSQMGDLNANEGKQFKFHPNIANLSGTSQVPKENVRLSGKCPDLKDQRG